MRITQLQAPTNSAKTLRFVSVFAMHVGQRTSVAFDHPVEEVRFRTKPWLEVHECLFVGRAWAACVHLLALPTRPALQAAQHRHRPTDRPQLHRRISLTLQQHKLLRAGSVRTPRCDKSPKKHTGQVRLSNTRLSPSSVTRLSNLQHLFHVFLADHVVARVCGQRDPVCVGDAPDPSLGSNRSRVLTARALSVHTTKLFPASCLRRLHFT